MYLALTALAVLGLPALASAATITGVKAAIKPIPGFPETGDILGAGAEVEIEGRLEGDELPGGLPLQTRKLVVYFPAGTKIDPTGFPTCTVAKLERSVRKVVLSSHGSRWHGRRGRSDRHRGSDTRGRGPGSLHHPRQRGRGVRECGVSDLGSDRHPGTVGNRPATVWAEADVQHPAGRLGSRGAPGIRDLSEREGRRRDPQERQDLLLRPRPGKVPQGRLPRQGRSHLGRRPNHRHRSQGPMPDQEIEEASRRNSAGSDPRSRS